MAWTALKTAIFRKGIGTPYNTWFLGPTRFSPPNGISIGSPVFVGLTNVTNGHTDVQTDKLRYTSCVAIGRYS